MPHVSVQLYTLRDLAAGDLLGTCRELAQMGFDGVELAGTFGLNALTLGRELTAMGLVISGAHVPLAELESDLPAQADYYARAGATRLIVPWLPEEDRRSADTFERVGERLARLHTRLMPYGLELFYHNHDFELQSFRGQWGLEWILQQAPQVGLELDCYWIEKAGHSAAAYLSSHPGRVKLLHAKDLAPDGRFAPVGLGRLDWNAIFHAAPRGGVEWAVVEQDDCYGADPRLAVRQSLEFLRSRRLVDAPARA